MRRDVPMFAFWAILAAALLTATAVERPLAQAGSSTQPPLTGRDLVRGEPFRGKYRSAFEKPVAFGPGEPAVITYELPDVYTRFVKDIA